MSRGNYQIRRIQGVIELRPQRTLFLKDARGGGQDGPLLGWIISRRSQCSESILRTTPNDNQTAANKHTVV